MAVNRRGAGMNRIPHILKPTYEPLEILMRSLCLALSLSLSLIVGAWAADSAAEQAKLQGKWQAVERNGAPAPDVVGHELAITGNRFQITHNGRLLYGGTCTLDPEAQPA